MKWRNLYKEGKIFNILLKNLSYLHFRTSRKCCEQHLDFFHSIWLFLVALFFSGFFSLTSSRQDFEFYI